MAGPSRTFSAQMVGRWRARFVVRRADGLFDEPRPGVPRTITDAQVDAGVEPLTGAPFVAGTRIVTEAKAGFFTLRVRAGEQDQRALCAGTPEAWLEDHRYLNMP